MQSFLCVIVLENDGCKYHTRNLLKRILNFPVNIQLLPFTGSSMIYDCFGAAMFLLLVCFKNMTVAIHHKKSLVGKQLSVLIL